MKTLEQIQKSIDEISTKVKWSVELTNKDRNKMIKDLKRLIEAKYYLEHNPKESFIKSELNRLTRAVKILEKGFREWLNNSPKAKELQNPKSKYRKEVNITDMNRQIKMLNFLLEA